MRRKTKSPAVVALLDILLAGVMLCVFAFFHHVLPAMKSASERENAVQPAAVEQTPVVTPEPSEVVAAPEPEKVVPEAPKVDNRTEWQIKFADHFTDEVVVTDHSYTSPWVSINIDKIETSWPTKSNWPLVYYVADIYVGSLECFRTGTANNEMVYCKTQDIMEIDAAVDSLLSINGDFFAYQTKGLMIRNGEIYAANANWLDTCVMFYDGSIETYKAGQFEIEELMDRGVYQAWSFGPPLLDEEGKALTYVSKNDTVDMQNPRSAIGYYEPGHYCFIVVDGRNNRVSKGVTLPMLSQIFAELGCKCAYNLDGGGSAMMIFNHERISVPSNGDRKLSDILAIVDITEAS